MCCNSKVPHWSTILIALAAAAVPTLLYFFGIIADIFPLTLIAIAIATVAIFNLGYFAYFGKERRSHKNSLLGSENPCCCNLECICQYSTEILVYAGLLFFAAFIAVAAVNSATFGLLVALVAIVSFLLFATLLTVIRLINCYVNERCE